jgi:hypothetical protein
LALLVIALALLSLMTVVSAPVNETPYSLQEIHSQLFQLCVYSIHNVPPIMGSRLYLTFQTD